MSGEVYAIVASAARYWFLFLAVIIVLRSFSYLRKDKRLRKKQVKRLPDAGYVGELIVLAGSEDLPEGTALPLPCEGIIGSLRICDVVVPVPGVADRHILFSFVKGHGLEVAPYSRGAFQVDKDSSSGHGKPLMMLHGSRLTIGEAVLRMRLFVGVDAPVYAAPRDFDSRVDDAPEPVRPWDHTDEAQEEFLI